MQHPFLSALPLRTNERLIWSDGSEQLLSSCLSLQDRHESVFDPISIDFYKNIHSLHLLQRGILYAYIENIGMISNVSELKDALMNNNRYETDDDYGHARLFKKHF